MSVGRGANFSKVPLNIVGSSTYGIYEKMDSEKTFNMTISDGWLVPYPGYKIGLKSKDFNDAPNGRALYESVKLDRIISVFGNGVFLITLDYDHNSREVINSQIIKIGELQTTDGVVYIAENNKPQIIISDGRAMYIYDPQLEVKSLIFTATISSPGALTIASTERFELGEPITFTTTGTLPAPLKTVEKFYIGQVDDSVPGQTTINVCLNPTDVAEGVFIKTTSTGTGVQTLTTKGPFQKVQANFTPGYIVFHDTYILAAASHDAFFEPPGDNSWRLSQPNNGFIWANNAQSIGLLESKPDIIQAVVRFPSRGNMILVMGETTTEYWYNTGAKLFPYQRQNQSSIDYGCLNAATVAFLDEYVIWLARNEKSGPVIMFTTGGSPTKVTTDGIDFQLSEIGTPEDSEGFLYRKNGHLFYHLNFYTDNLSFVVDLNTNKIFNASDHAMNYYGMGAVVWFKNQYFAITKDNGNLFIFDTVITTYDFIDTEGNKNTVEIPRIRECVNVRKPSQDYFIINDVGFTIETGETDYQFQNHGPIFLTTQDGNRLVTEPTTLTFLQTQDGKFIEYQNGGLMLSQQASEGESNLLISQQDDIVPVTPRVDMSISYDGGAIFNNVFPYELNPIGKRKNRLLWWQLGIANDVVFQFRFWGLGRFVVTDGEVNIR